MKSMHELTKWRQQWTALRGHLTNMSRIALHVKRSTSQESIDAKGRPRLFYGD